MNPIKFLHIIICLLITSVCFCQTKPQTFGDQIFLPAIDIGYMYHGSNQLLGGVIIKTSIEYRFRNNNDLFIRINYDTHNAEYTLDNLSTMTNVINGKTAFTDILLGAGYRFGAEKLQYFVMIQPGTRLYNYPNAIQNGNTITIEQSNNSIFTARTTLGLEYYFNAKAALSVDLFQSQVWKSKDFWDNQNGGALGFSIGITTALF